MVPHQTWYTEAPVQDENQFSTRLPWPHFKGIWKMVSAQYLKKYLLKYPHRIWYTGEPGQDKDQVQTRWPWPYSQGHKGHLKWQHMKDGFCSITQEIFEVSSPNVVHRSTRARQEPGSNQVTLTSFSRSQRSFKVTAYDRWFLLHNSRNIWRILTKFGTQKHQGKIKTKF